MTAFTGTRTQGSSKFIDVTSEWEVTGDQTHGLNGGDGDDTLEAIVDGTGQAHLFGNEGDDFFVLDLTNYSGHQGHHVYGGEGADVFHFTNAHLAFSPVVGRINDFEPSRDRVLIDGQLLDLTSLPSQMQLLDGSTVSVRIVEYASDIGANSAEALGLGPQQFLQVGNNVLYALDGARAGGTERHYFQMPDPSDLVEVSYHGQVNFVPFEHYENLNIRIRNVTHSDDGFNGFQTPEYIRGNVSGAEDGVGSGAHETIFANGGNDVVDGATGEDLIYGGVGDDSIAGGLEDDTLLGEEGSDILWGGSGNDFLDGGQDSDLLIGGRGDDWLEGSAGEDTLEGGDGDDTLNGGDQNDWLVGGLGADHAHGGHGDDGVSYADAETGVSVDFHNDGRNSGEAAGDTFQSVEAILGSLFDDDLRAYTGANQILGHDGDDKLYGRRGGDTLIGGAGDDFLNGGPGDDQLEGLLGADIFRFQKGFDSDEVLDFQDDIDRIQFKKTHFQDVADALNSASEVGDNVVFYLGAGDVLTVRNISLSEIQDDLQVI